MTDIERGQGAGGKRCPRGQSWGSASGHPKAKPRDRRGRQYGENLRSHFVGDGGMLLSREVGGSDSPRKPMLLNLISQSKGEFLLMDAMLS